MIGTVPKVIFIFIFDVKSNGIIYARKLIAIMCMTEVSEKVINHYYLESIICDNKKIGSKV